MHPLHSVGPCRNPHLPTGVDPLPPELEGQLESELLTAPFFIEAAVVLPQHQALLLADTGGRPPALLRQAGRGRLLRWGRQCGASSKQPPRQALVPRPGESHGRFALFFPT